MYKQHRLSYYRDKQLLKRILLVALLGVTGVTPVMAEPVSLPPIVSPASQEHHVGKVIFVEMVTPDIIVAKQFYAELFGWTFQDIQLGDTQYAEAFMGERPVAGLIQKSMPTGEHRQPAWRSFFAVTDVDAAVKVAQQNGAKILFEAHNIPDRGREAILADPQGAVFAILASSSGDMPDVLAESGAWIWSSLHTSNPDSDSAFYQTLFNYEIFELPAKKGNQHLLLSSDNYARASVNTLPANTNNTHPHWLNYVRVDDADKMAEKVVALGGSILVKPHTDRHGGKIAVVVDPLGAPFGLFEWSDTNSSNANSEVSK